MHNLIWLLLGNLLAGNLLGAIHGAAHTLCQNKSNHPRVSHLVLHYWWMHLAHHIAEDVPGIAETDRRPFMRTPFTGWLFILGGMALITGLLWVPVVSFLALLGADLMVARPLAFWAGTVCFFLQYEVMHRRTHRGRRWFTSPMHAVHHQDWGRNFGIAWCYNLLPRYGMRWVHACVIHLRGAEEILARLPLIRESLSTLVDNGRKRYKWSLEVKRRYKLQAQPAADNSTLTNNRPVPAHPT